MRTLLLGLVLAACSSSAAQADPPAAPPTSPPSGDDGGVTDSGGGGASCAVSADARPLLMHAAMSALADIAYVAEGASAKERPFSYSLVGASDRMWGTATAVSDCTA